jgi:hypothetical protein
MAIVGMYKQNIESVGVASTDITMKTAVVPRGQIVEVTHASLSDYTTANRKLSIGIRDVNNNDIYIIVDKQANTYSTWINGRVMLYEGECMIGLVENTNTADVLSLVVHGKRYMQMAT